MSLALAQSATALAPGLSAHFLASGGTAPFTYGVQSGGAGGTINSTTGLYTAPAVAPADPAKAYDTVRVSDSLGGLATAKILVGNALVLFCEILQRELGLQNGRVYLWDQKWNQPDDFGLYIAVSVATCKCFGNTLRPGPTGWDSAVQAANMMATLDLDVISRDASARDRKEEILLALNSIYSQSQQEINSFCIGKIPAGARFQNLSFVDGAAIPYRFRIPVNLQYAVVKTQTIPYFDTFQNVEVTTDP